MKIVAAALAAAGTAIGCILSRFNFECVFSIMIAIVGAVTVPIIARGLARIIRPMASAMWHKLSEFLDMKVTAYSVIMTLVGWVEYGSTRR